MAVGSPNKAHAGKPFSDQARKGLAVAIICVSLLAIYAWVSVTRGSTSQQGIGLVSSLAEEKVRDGPLGSSRQ
jgi:hypothetical protein